MHDEVAVSVRGIALLPDRQMHKGAEFLLRLANKEAKLLRYLMLNRGSVKSLEDIFKVVFPDKEYSRTLVGTIVHRIRTKTKPILGEPFIHTVPGGRGYIVY